MMPAGHHSDSDSTLLPLPKSSITWFGGIFARLPPLAARLVSPPVKSFLRWWFTEISISRLIHVCYALSSCTIFENSSFLTTLLILLLIRQSIIFNSVATYLTILSYRRCPMSCESTVHVIYKQLQCISFRAAVFDGHRSVGGSLLYNLCIYTGHPRLQVYVR